MKTDSTIIGREDEIKILESLLHSPRAELLAIYGRRRVGKTYLIRSYYKKQMVFSCSGQYQGKTSDQLINFTAQFNSYFPHRSLVVPPKTWKEAFVILRNAIFSLDYKEKQVIFFDELPWLDTHKSGFLSAFSYFWNEYASLRNDLLVVICGSAASWIINKVVNNKGGLHNRITRQIRLLPFTLKETKQYLDHYHIQFEYYDLLRLYMVLGGIPHYLNAVQRGNSVSQNIARICFSKDGLLTNEFNNLYAALFNSSEKHMQVVKALALKNKGLTRNELVKAVEFETGGALTMILEELTESGFIGKVYPFEKQEKNALYRLQDEFSLFYYRFMTNGAAGEDEWGNAGHKYTIWCGYAFENLCIKHISQIKQALQIAGIRSRDYSWYKAGNRKEDGAQIDWLIDRADNCVNLCEMKFSNTEYTIDKKYAKGLAAKKSLFVKDTRTRKTLFTTMITTFGLTDNEHKQKMVDISLTMDALFS